MRVTCEKCGAAYAVDEKRIPAKGARAQCPKCKGVQVVKRPEASEPAAAMPAPAPAARPAPGGANLAELFAPPPSPGPRPTSEVLSDIFGPSSGLSGPPNPFGSASAASAEPFGAGAPAPGAMPDFFGTPGSAARPEEPPAPKASLSDIFGPAGGAGSSMSDLFGASDGAGSGIAQAPVIPCRECGTPMPDPLDAALGICERCRSGQPARRASPAAQPGYFAPAAAPIPAAAPAPPTTSSGKVPVVVFGGAAASPPPVAAPQAAPYSAPLPAPALASHPDADFLDAPPASLGGNELDLGGGSGGELALELDRPEPVNPRDWAAKPTPAPVKPAAPRPPPKIAASAPAPSGNADPSRVLPRPKVAEPRSGGAWKVVIPLVLLVVLGAGAGLWITKPAFLFKPEEPPKPKLLPEIETRLLAWKMALPGLSGTSEEHLKRGIELYRDDRHTSYIEAQEAFKAAVVLEPQNLEAVARYVESFAVGQGERASQDRLDEARDLLFGVLRERPKLAAAHRAKANLLLATGQDDLARAEAEEAFNLSTDAERPEALLAWGRTYLKKSAPIAQEKFEEALQKDSSLKRALYYRGLAAEFAGNFAKAIAGYQERLKLDADQRDALRALARVLVRVGNHEAARKAIADYSERYPDIGEPKVMNAQFTYMAQGDVRGAERILRGLEQELDLFDDSDRLQYHLLWSAIARERGDLKGAVTHAEEALKISPGNGPAHFQAMLAALKSGQADSAREHLRACEQGLGDAARFLEYRGRVELAASELDGAIAAFRKASERAPTRLTPRLCAAALLARRGDENGAWSVLQRMLDLEPSSVARKRRPVSDYYEPELETARHAAGAFAAKAKDEDQWVRDIYAAIVDYHLGELDGPARMLDRGLQIDMTSLPALLYRAQIELDRKRPKSALAFAKRASTADRENAVANYLIARSLEALGRDIDARAAYLEALGKNPRLAQANIQLALLLARSGSKDEAKDRLLAVVSDEPENLEARVALFDLGY